jgi:xylulokinase
MFIKSYNAMKKYLIGYDIGSSSVKASLVEAESGRCVASAFYPKSEAPIMAKQPGWAEQDPNSWWQYLCEATSDVMATSGAHGADVAAIGISYQMHGLVCVDKHGAPLRPSIIWCDSRAVPYGQRAFETIGEERCLSHLLNSPGNFTASKLAWVKEHEPELFAQIDKIMLPGDYIALRLTGEACTTVSGLSEGMFWDFREGCLSEDVMNYYGFAQSLIPTIRPTFAPQGELTASAAAQLGLSAGIPVTYRAGDQPNNALSLGVFNPGEIASTAGTSGVVYGVLGNVNYDPKSRVNTFAHVNHTDLQTRLGVLLCINGTGILNSWIRRNVLPDGISYAEMNDMAASAPIGAAGVSILPFGNGAERVLENRAPGCSIHGVNFNTHTRAHLLRAAQEGIVFSFKYGIDVMEQMGMEVSKIHAGHANMFLSPLFRQTLANVTGATIELYDTDGSVGAAKGAGIGAGIYKDHTEAFASLQKLAVVEPRADEVVATAEAYERWKSFV